MVWTAEAGLRFGCTFRPPDAPGCIHRAAKAETGFRSPYLHRRCPPLPIAPLCAGARASFGKQVLPIAGNCCIHAPAGERRAGLNAAR